MHSSKLRIAIWYNVPCGGAKRALFHHIQGLVERGHYVEVWCPPSRKDELFPLGGLVTEHVLPLEAPPERPRGFFGGYFRDINRVIGLLKAVEDHCRLCAREIDGGGFDVLITHPCHLFGTNPMARLVRIPAVLYLQEPYRPLYETMSDSAWGVAPENRWAAPPDEASRLFSLKHWRRRIGVSKDSQRVQAYRIQVREEIGNATRFKSILVNSRFSRESLLRAYGLDSRVCYLGIDAETFRPLGLPRENLVIGLGSVQPAKGIHHIVRAIATIEEGRRPAMLWVGNYSFDAYAGEIGKLAVELGVNLTVKVRISDDELLRDLNRAGVMVNASTLEPFGFAPLEAAACETPVVAIAEGGVRETIRDEINGLLVSDARPKPLGDAIARLLGDPVLGRTLGEGGRRMVLEKWTWERAVDRLEECLAEVLPARV